MDASTVELQHRESENKYAVLKKRIAGDVDVYITSITIYYKCTHFIPACKERRMFSKGLLFSTHITTQSI